MKQGCNSNLLILNALLELVMIVMMMKIITKIINFLNLTFVLPFP